MGKDVNFFINCLKSDLMNSIGGEGVSLQEHFERRLAAEQENDTSTGMPDQLCRAYAIVKKDIFGSGQES